MLGQTRLDVGNARDGGGTISVDLPLNLDLLSRYGKPGPRYTSYPTAPHFEPESSVAAFRRFVAETAEAVPPRTLSLYVHMPFCSSPCLYFWTYFWTYFSTAREQLAGLEADGLVWVCASRIVATRQGRYLLRVIAACFDRYLGVQCDRPPPAARSSNVL